MAKKPSEHQLAHREKEKARRAALKKVRARLKLAKADLRKLISQEKHLSKRKMRPGGGRGKGNGFENHVSKLIVAALKDFSITREDCYRTPLSGGHRFAKAKDPGDLQLSKKALKIFPFSVECKDYKEVYLPALWMPEKKWLPSWKFPSWLKQCCAATNQHRHPLLVFKGNGTPIFAALPELVPMTLRIKHKLYFQYKGEQWVCVLFSDLLRAIVKQHQ